MSSPVLNMTPATLAEPISPPEFKLTGRRLLLAALAALCLLASSHAQNAAPGGDGSPWGIGSSVMRRIAPDKTASMSLRYESVKGYKGASRYTLPADDKWHEAVWRLTDANIED